MEVSQDFPGTGPHQNGVNQCGFQSRWKDHLYLASEDRYFETVEYFPQESVSRLSRATATWGYSSVGIQSRWKDCCIWLVGDKTLKLWSVSSGECLEDFPGSQPRCIYSVAFSPDGRTFVSGSWRQHFETVVCFLAESVSRLSWATATMYAVWLSVQMEGPFVSGSGDKTLKLWSVSSGECLKTFQGHSHTMYGCVAFSPDGRTFVSGSEDNTLKLWSVSSGECLKTFQGHSNYVNSVAFSPDGRTVVSGSGTTILWNCGLFPQESVSRLSRATDD